MSEQFRVALVPGVPQSREERLLYWLEDAAKEVARLRRSDAPVDRLADLLDQIRLAFSKTAADWYKDLKSAGLGEQAAVEESLRLVDGQNEFFQGLLGRKPE